MPDIIIWVTDKKYSRGGEKIVTNREEKNNELQEIKDLVSKLNPEQKKIVLATVKGAVLIAECDKEDPE